MFTTKKQLEAEFKLKEKLLEAEYAKKEAEQEGRWAHQDHVQFQKFCEKTVAETKDAASRAEAAYERILTVMEKALDRPVAINVLNPNPPCQANK